MVRRCVSRRPLALPYVIIAGPRTTDTNTFSTLEAMGMSRIVLEGHVQGLGQHAVNPQVDEAVAGRSADRQGAFRVDALGGGVESPILRIRELVPTPFSTTGSTTERCCSVGAGGCASW